MSDTIDVLDPATGEPIGQIPAGGPAEADRGREIASACARQLTKCVLELGGKDALIVDAGVDPQWAADQAATARSQRSCTSRRR